MHRHVFNALLLSAGLAMPTAGFAQVSEFLKRTPDQLLESYRRAAAMGEPAGDATYVLTHPESYPRNDLMRLLDGLEGVALSNSESHRARMFATAALALPGSTRLSHPIPGIVVHLERIYKKADDQEVRSVAVSSMAGLVEEKQAAAFLERLARTSPEDPDYPRAVRWALHTLPVAGEEGRAAMKRLNEGEAVHDADSRAALKELAKSDYRLKKSQ